MESRLHFTHGMATKYSSGEAVLVDGTAHDGKVGTVLKPVGDDEYLIVLEDGTQILVHQESLMLRH